MTDNPFWCDKCRTIDESKCKCKKGNAVIVPSGDLLSTLRSILKKHDYQDLFITDKEILKTIDAICDSEVNNRKPEYMRANILRNWSREDIDRFAKHLLGEQCQKCSER